MAVSSDAWFSVGTYEIEQPFQQCLQGAWQAWRAGLELAVVPVLMEPLVPVCLWKPLKELDFSSKEEQLHVCALVCFSIRI